MNKKILCIGFIVIAVLISLSAVSGGLFDSNIGEVQDISLSKPTTTDYMVAGQGTNRVMDTYSKVSMEFVPYEDIDNYKDIKIINGKVKYKNGTTKDWKDSECKLGIEYRNSGVDPQGFLLKNNLYTLHFTWIYKNLNDAKNIDSFSGDIVADTTTNHNLFLTHFDKKVNIAE